MALHSLMKKATRNPYRVLDEPEFWTPLFCRTFFDWCDEQAFNVPQGQLVRGELALELAKKTGDQHTIAKGHGVKASAYRIISLYDYAEAELDIALTHARSCSCCLGELYRRQGILHYHQRKFDSSIPLFDTAIEHCLIHQNRDGVGRALVSRGAALGLLGRIDESLHDEHRALSMLSPLSPQFYHLGVLTNIMASLVTGSDEHFAHADRYCRQFRQYLEGLDGFTILRIRLSWAHGAILVRLGERKRGLQMLRKARSALIHARCDSEVIAITADISHIYCDTGKYHLIVELVREVLEKLGDFSGARPLLERLLHKAQWERVDTRNYALELRSAVAAAIPCLRADCQTEAFSTP